MLTDKESWLLVLKTQSGGAFWTLGSAAKLLLFQGKKKVQPPWHRL
jgi:hypothetical protein